MNVDSLKKSLAQVTYSDGQLEQVQLENGDACVLFRDWQDQIWRFLFREVVFFQCYEFGGHVEGVSTCAASPEIEEAFTVIEQHSGNRLGYPGLAQVSFLSEGAPALTVVFQDLRIESM